MKLNNVMMASVLALGLSSSAFAADQGHGKVTFTGSIIDAPCSIKPQSIDQTVELGQISNASLLNAGKSQPRVFTIELEDCVFTGPAAANKVSVTFTGMESVANNGLLGITGSASGASVAITDGAGEVIKLGQGTKPQELQDSPSNTLKFSAYLQGDGAAATITEGSFQSVADFTLAYN